jgi:hypothetical protein
MRAFTERKRMMEFPLLGTLSHDADYDWLVSAPVAVPALDGLECEFCWKAMRTMRIRKNFMKPSGAF